MRQVGFLLLALAFGAGVAIQKIPDLAMLAGLLDIGRIITFLVGGSLVLIGHRRVRALAG